MSTVELPPATQTLAPNRAAPAFNHASTSVRGRRKMSMNVLVPLDGTDLGTSILPDARRLAGPHGEIILVQDATLHEAVLLGFVEQRLAFEAAERYLASVAQSLHAEGVSVQTHPLVGGDAANSIRDAAERHRVDIIACATHGRGRLGRLWRGSVAWRVLANSSVPVLLRHATSGQSQEESRQATGRRIMVPLDGSTVAEAALPLAQELALRWNAALWLVHVLPDIWTGYGSAFGAPAGRPMPYLDMRHTMQQYLQRTASELEGEVRADVVTGSAVDALTDVVTERNITDIVMASHGQGGLARAVLGSVTDGLVHRLRLPILVVPALTPERAVQGTPVS